MARYVVLAASVIISFCLGGVYAWSAFVPGLKADHGLTAAQSQLIFGVTILVFTLVTIPAGRLFTRWGPRRMVAAGGFLLAAGYWISAAGQGSFPWMLAGIGLVGGTGIGMAYLCPVSVNVRWFPDNKGLITGVTVCGFGAGGIALAWVVGALSARGISIPSIFEWVALGYAAILVPVAQFLQLPPEASSASPETDEVSAGQLLRNPGFWLLSLGIFAGTFSGLLVVGNLSSIGLEAGLDPATATTAVGIFALGNAAGRIAWGWLSDLFGRPIAPASLVMLAGSIFFLGLPAVGGTGFLLAAAACGFGFGGCFVIYAAQVSQRFGVARFASVYPLVFLFYGISGILGPVSGGLLVDATGSHRLGILLATGISLFGGFGYAALDRRTPRRSHLGGVGPENERSGISENAVSPPPRAGGRRQLAEKKVPRDRIFLVD